MPPAQDRQPDRNATLTLGSASKAPAYLNIYRASGIEQVRLVKAGVPAVATKRIIRDLMFDQKSFLNALNLKTATLNRRIARNEMLASDEGERLLGIAKLVGQVESMVEESGDGRDFDAAAWLAQWLREPVPAFGGIRPIELLDTMVGQALVGQALAQAQSGAYA